MTQYKKKAMGMENMKKEIKCHIKIFKIIWTQTIKRTNITF